MNDQPIVSLHAGGGGQEALDERGRWRAVTADEQEGEGMTYDPDLIDEVGNAIGELLVDPGDTAGDAGLAALDAIGHGALARATNARNAHEAAVEDGDLRVIVDAVLGRS